MFFEMLDWWEELDTRVKGTLLGLAAVFLAAVPLWLIADRVDWALAVLSIGTFCFISGLLIYRFSGGYKQERACARRKTGVEPLTLLRRHEHNHRRSQAGKSLKDLFIYPKSKDMP